MTFGEYTRLFLPVTIVRAQRQANALMSTSSRWRVWQKSRIPCSQSPKLLWHCDLARTAPLQNVSLVSSTLVRYASLNTNSSRLADWKSSSWNYETGTSWRAGSLGKLTSQTCDDYLNICHLAKTGCWKRDVRLSLSLWHFLFNTIGAI